MTFTGKLTTAILAVTMTVGAGAALAEGGKRHYGKAGFDFATLDADGDGEISLQDLEAAQTARRAALDSDGDGFVTLEDMQAIGRKGADERAKRMFDRFDADGDGKIAIEDLPQRRGGAEKMFDRMDADGDGVVSKAEFEAAKEKMRDRMQARRDGKAAAQDGQG